MKKKEVIVVGGGLAGLSAAMRLAENGCFVKIISVTQAKRSHSVCAQGELMLQSIPKGKKILQSFILMIRLKEEIFRSASSNIGNVFNRSSYH